MRRKHRPTGTPAPTLLLALTCMAAFIAACSGAPEPATDDTAADESDRVDAELEAVYQTFTRAYRLADVQMLMDSVYADSGFYLPPGSPILRGQDQFRGQFSFLERFARDATQGPAISFEIVDRDISNDLAYDIGTYTIRPPAMDPNAPGTQGKFIVIWKRQPNGEWRIHADGFSPVR